jgi:hypothetical protein
MVPLAAAVHREIVSPHFNNKATVITMLRSETIIGYYGK